MFLGANIRVSEQDEYKYTPLDDRWTYSADTQLVKLLQTSNHDWCSPKQAEAMQTDLCARCNAMQIWKSTCLFSDTMENLARTSNHCDLCALLLRMMHGTKTSALPSGCVSFVRLGSTLAWDMDTVRPLACLYQSLTTTDAATLKCVQSGFPVLSPAGSLPHLKILSAWLQDCDETHGCLPRSDMFFPTRVIDVESPRSSMVHLTEDFQTQSQTGRYAALSHRWGPQTEHGTFCTYRSNRVEFRNGIPLSRLPKTFRDAVLVTRRLGIRYLWIDSLCIIQDDVDDWATESKLMEQVFSSAYVTLAASCANDTNDGFLKSRPPRTSIASVTSDGHPYYVCEPIDDFSGDVEHGELNKRGWVLQERALSRRTIHFAEKQSYWECGAGVRCETLTKMRNRKASFLGDANFPHAVESYVKGMKLEFFQNLYGLYSNLALSFKTDRPIAIQGLERRLIRTLGTTGGYGVFDCYLHRSLLWCRADQSLERIPGVHHRSTPSWSWMAYYGPIRYLKVPYGTLSWNQKIVSPFAADSSAPIQSEGAAASMSIRAEVWDVLDTQGAEVYMDEASFSSARRIKAVIVGTEKSERTARNKLCYVLFVVSASDEMANVYERVGVGMLEERQLAMEEEPVGIWLH